MPVPGMHNAVWPVMIMYLDPGPEWSLQLNLAAAGSSQGKGPAADGSDRGGGGGGNGGRAGPGGPWAAVRGNKG